MFSSEKEKDMCCKNELNLCKLCVKSAKFECLWSDDIKSKDICTDCLKAKTLWANNQYVNDVCVSDTLKANHIKSVDINANYICSQQGTINKLCVNDLTVGSLKYCEKYLASVTFSGDTVYSLGSNVDWNLIINDPNGNVSLAPFSYTVPVSGYYTFSYYLNSTTLTGPSVIAGIPVGVMTAQVNGVDLRKNNEAFLSFSDLQYSVLSSLVLLSAGDVITMKYEVLVLDPVSGLMSYPGTVIIKSTGVLPVVSGFDIHYLSSVDCSPVICQSCPPVELECPIVDVDCHKRTAQVEEPFCNSCR